MSRQHSSENNPTAQTGAVSLKAVVWAALLIGAVILVLRAVLGTVKETSSAVSERNKTVAEQRKALINEQTERLKNAREAQAAP